MSRQMDEALGDVARAYDRPEAVRDDPRLQTDEKVRLLKQWEYDLRELQVATEENMAGDSSGRNAELLRAVRACLNDLAAGGDIETSGASKHGG